MVNLVAFALTCFSCILVFCDLGYAFPNGKHKQTPLGVPYQGSPVTLSRRIYHSSSIPFKKNDGWLGMNLDYKYVEPIANKLNSTEQPLFNRGESHITVVTPPEFNLLANAGVTLDEINNIARQHKIQASRFRVVCLGREDVKVDNEQYIVYQLIVDSRDLLNIRRAIFRLYASKGGNTALFNPDNYNPHITVAFSVNDLFEANGVSKGYNVCYSPIHFVH
ncbi:hypothetical protein O0I10_011371 [Lichtheimia ornata]|uniref:Swiss Army Knife 2H phosphoesterase domain-containing protein n=1 Tax=Lichtheimia ornata TaxID=688661 RepID=A0AAD7UTL1_9FUNG|nr:uncharacterized protein O0I10_011371 [Lichtheimia ornata]KAJ8652990.1 hypothetical protein O0I10_011371 [Lichtheimia ornata]